MRVSPSTLLCGFAGRVLYVLRGLLEFYGLGVSVLGV